MRPIRSLGRKPRARYRSRLGFAEGALTRLREDIEEIARLNSLVASGLAALARSEATAAELERREQIVEVWLSVADGSRRRSKIFAKARPRSTMTSERSELWLRESA